MEEEISLIEIFQILKKRLGLILTATGIGLVLAAIFTFIIATPVYESTTQLLVSRPADENAIQQSEINANIQMINTYEDIIRNPVILDPVIEEMGMDTTVDDLREQITVGTGEESQVFSVSVQDESPYQAAEIANTTADVFQNDLDSIMSVDNVSIISQAVPSTSPVSPNNVLNLIIGLLLGGMIGVGLAFLREFLDNSVKDEDFVIQETGWTSLGRISEMTESDTQKKTRNTDNYDESTSRTDRSRV